MSEGSFIVIEGIDGAGKTTVAKELTRRLNGLGIKSIYTYEPFYKFSADFITAYWGDLDPILQTLIMALDRYYHIKKEVIPYLNSGYVVISDRYYYSSIAYQGAQGADINWILSVNRYVLRPKLAIYLDVEPDVGLMRKKHSATRVKELESNLELIKRAREIYLELVRRGELILVDAMRDLNSVLDEVFNLIIKYVKA